MVARFLTAILVRRSEDAHYTHRPPTLIKRYNRDLNQSIAFISENS
jgi:hypothetical protein